MPPDGENSNQGSGDIGPVIATIPEGMRGHEALKDVKDIGGLVKGLVSIATPKPFADTLPADIKADAAFVDIKDMDGLARGYRSLKSHFGVPATDLVRYPRGEAAAKDESWDPVYQQLGRPEKPEGYKIEPPAGQKWGEDDLAFHGALRPAFLKAGLNQRQVDIIRGSFDEYGKGLAAKIETAGKEAISAALNGLKAEWGTGFEQRVARAGSALEWLGKEAKIDLGAFEADLKAGSIAQRLTWIKLLDHLGGQFEEDGVLKGRGGEGEGTPPGVTEAKQQIAALRASDEWKKAAFNKQHPQHAEVLAKMAKLHEAAYPETAA